MLVRKPSLTKPIKGTLHSSNHSRTIEHHISPVPRITINLTNTKYEIIKQTAK